jgi:hypothetical protein
MPKASLKGNPRKGTRKGIPPKKATSPPGKKPAPAKKGWEWAPFTVKSTLFNEKARELSELLVQTYGDEVTISKYEKMMAAFPAMPEERKVLIHFTDELKQAYADFKQARLTRDTERETFRGDIAVADVETGFNEISKFTRKAEDQSMGE